MCASLLVVAYDVTFGSTLTADQIDSFGDQSFSLTDSGLCIPCYVWFQHQFFEQDLDELYHLCHEDHIKVKGNIFVAHREHDEDEPTQMCIRLDNKGYELIPCTFMITMKKSGGSKKKALTTEEKVGLFKEYWEIKRQPPTPTEVYKEFRIGSFYSTCLKNSEMMQTLNSIISGDD